MTTFIVILSFSTHAMDDNEYNLLLQKHKKGGHMSDKDVLEQKKEYINSKKTQKDFNKQVRGVASHIITNPKKTMTFENPDIEIPVK